MHTRHRNPEPRRRHPHLALAQRMEQGLLLTGPPQWQDLVSSQPSCRPLPSPAGSPPFPLLGLSSGSCLHCPHPRAHKTLQTLSCLKTKLGPRAAFALKNILSLFPPCSFDDICCVHKNCYPGAAWVARSVVHPTLGLGSGHNLGLGLGLRLTLTHAQHQVQLGVSLSSPSAPPSYVLTLALSNTYIFKKKKKA